MARELPRPALPSSTIELDGQPVAFHSLSRHQAITLNSYKGRPDEAEDYILAGGLDITIEEAHAWRDAVTLELAGQLVDAILDISGLTDTGAGDEEDDEAPDPKG